MEAQTKLLVDSGLIANEYVVLYELAINDSNHIYSIQAADCPNNQTPLSFPLQTLVPHPIL